MSTFKQQFPASNVFPFNALTTDLVKSLKTEIKYTDDPAPGPGPGNWVVQTYPLSANAILVNLGLSGSTEMADIQLPVPKPNLPGVFNFGRIIECTHPLICLNRASADMDVLFGYARFTEDSGDQIQLELSFPDNTDYLDGGFFWQQFIIFCEPV